MFYQRKKLYLVTRILSIDGIPPRKMIKSNSLFFRVIKQRLREAQLQAMDYLILLLAGACLGTLAKVSDETMGFLGYTYTVIAVCKSLPYFYIAYLISSYSDLFSLMPLLLHNLISFFNLCIKFAALLCKISALRSFTLDRLQFCRESSSGISTLAYFLAKDSIDHFNTIVKPLVYLSMFFFFSNPRSSFIDNYTVLVCLVYCVTGIAYIFAIFLEPSPAQLVSNSNVELLVDIYTYSFVIYHVHMHACYILCLNVFFAVFGSCSCDYDSYCLTREGRK